MRLRCELIANWNDELRTIPDEPEKRIFSTESIDAAAAAANAKKVYSIKS